MRTSPGIKCTVTTITAIPTRLYVDTNVLIRMMERTDAGAADTARLVELAGRGKLGLVTSELTLSEVLVGPLAKGDLVLETAYLDLLIGQPLIELTPLSRAILIEAAHIRATSSAPLADCLHVASARLSGCGLIVSYDRRLRDLSKLDVVEPSDAVFATLDALSP